MVGTDDVQVQEEAMVSGDQWSVVACSMQSHGYIMDMHAILQGDHMRSLTLLPGLVHLSTLHETGQNDRRVKGLYRHPFATARSVQSGSWSTQRPRFSRYPMKAFARSSFDLAAITGLIANIQNMLKQTATIITIE